MPNIIDHFMKEYAFLSNFYDRQIVWKDHIFPTSEHVYHSEKLKDKKVTTLRHRVQLMIQAEIDSFNSLESTIMGDQKNLLINELSAGDAKKRYTLKKLKELKILRNDWFDINIQIMEDINIVKFTMHKDLGTKLISTGDAELIEGNYWGDDFWGKIKNPVTGEWIGRNELGKILMRVRKYIWDEKMSEGFR